LEFCCIWADANGIFESTFLSIGVEALSKAHGITVGRGECHDCVGVTGRFYLCQNKSIGQRMGDLANEVKNVVKRYTKFRDILEYAIGVRD
jgi:hypothetical protein